MHYNMYEFNLREFGNLLFIPNVNLLFFFCAEKFCLEFLLFMITISLISSFALNNVKGWDYIVLFQFMS